MSLFVGHNSDPQHIQALVDCKLQLPNLVGLFEQELASVKDTLIDADDITRLHQLQGQATVLRDFLVAVDIAQDIKTRMENS
jgi:hypothetical protein